MSLITSPLAPAWTSLLALAAVSASTTDVNAQCVGKYDTIPAAGAAGGADFWNVALDDDADEMAIIGEGGRVFVGSVPTGGEHWSSTTVELATLNNGSGIAPAFGRIAIDGDFIVASLAYYSTTQYLSQGFVAIYSRDAAGNWNGPISVMIAGYTDDPVDKFSPAGTATDEYGSAIDVVDGGSHALVFIGDPGVKPPSGARGFMSGDPDYVDGAVFATSVTPSGGIGVVTKVYRPGFTVNGTQPPVGIYTNSHFGFSLDANPIGDRIAIGAPEASQGGPFAQASTGTAFTYEPLLSGGGSTVIMTPNQTSPVGIVTPSVDANDVNLRAGRDVALNEQWLAVATTGNAPFPRTLLYTSTNGASWSANGSIPSYFDVELSKDKILIAPDYLGTLPTDLSVPVPVPFVGDDTTDLLSGAQAINDRFAAGAGASMDATTWRHDCGGSMLGYVDVASEYCTSEPNTTGVNAKITPVGSFFVADNDLVLETSDLPLNQFGYMLVALADGFVANAAGSQGNLCLSGEIGRYNNPVMNSGSTGSFDTTVDLTSLPLMTGSVVPVGETVYFQTYYRDWIGGGAVTNFSDAVSILFQ